MRQGYSALHSPAGTFSWRILRNYLDRVLACLAIIAVLGAVSNVSMAAETRIGLGIVWSASLPGVPRLCYDKVPAVIYMKYDLARKTTSIMKRELSGDEHLLGEFPGSPDPRSLSCSQDGSVIAAMDGYSQTLFLLRDSEAALYRLSQFWPFSNAGRYSFLAPDGKSITLSEKPDLISGPDLLHDMKIFPDKRSTVFFMNDYLYVNDVTGINKLTDVEGGRPAQGQRFKRPPGFEANEIVRCGDRDVASLVGTESSRYLVLDNAPPRKDWLEQIGVRKLFRKYHAPFLISGDYGTCGFPLLDHARPNYTIALASFDANGVQTFSLPYPEIRLINDNVSFGKNGCIALIQGFWSTQQGDDNTHLLAIQSQRCR